MDGSAPCHTVSLVGTLPPWSNAHLDVLADARRRAWSGPRRREWYLRRGVPRDCAAVAMDQEPAAIVPQPVAAEGHGRGRRAVDVLLAMEIMCVAPDGDI